ncbi:DNRLRE domain-containing protein [Vallitalea okinawensis]|uniref:DNRLRE domain-containing protein n=1 Tax=Vallitalea okinawensis TaxID=2078660 RepID=UPI000CFD418E|nr:DNRLRE domain-containing protein [Vallitalea okinawensis]
MNKNGVDSYISSDNPTSNYYLSSYLHAGNLSGYGTLRSFIRFKYLPTLAPGAKITRAYLASHMYLGSTNNTTIDVHEVTSSWNSNEITWDNPPQFDSTPVLSNYTSTPNTVWEFDITSVVNKWYKGQSANNGVALLASDEQSSKISFYSTDAAGQTNPKIVIEYEVDPLGIESYYGFDGNVNVHNGNLVLGATDVTLPGRGIPITVSRTYNSRSSDTGIVGSRWLLNVGMNLSYASDESSVMFIDGDGTKKYFVKDENGDYISPIGTKLTLSKDAQNAFYLEEKSGIKYYFDSQGRLDYIEDTNNNTTDYVYSETTGELINIIDPSLRQVTFTYENGKLKTITGNEISTIEYGYNGDYLETVTKKDGTTVLEQFTYGYDVHNNIATITDNANNITSILYSYDTPELGLRVQRIEKKLTINGILETLGTTYNYVEAANGDGIITTVTRPKGDATEYTTNKSGNVVNIIEDKNGKDITTVYNWDEKNKLQQVINPKGYDTIFGYTDKDEIGSIDNSKNERVSYDYDDNGDVIEIVDESGRPTTASYDPTTRNTISAINSQFSTTVMDYDDVGNVTMRTNPIGIGENPVANGTLETWVTGLPNRWATAQGSRGAIAISADSSTKVNGNYSVKLESTGSAYNQQAILVSDYIEVNASTKYNVSWYVKNSSISTTNATVEVHWYDSSKNLLSGQSTYNIAPTKGTQDWVRKGARIDAPLNDAAYAKIYLVLDNVGTAWFDNIQFEKGEVINNHNFLVNESFELDNDPTVVTPDNWDPATLTGIDGVNTDEARTGEKSILINGDPQNRHFAQAINFDGKAGTAFHFSGWSKASGVSSSGGYYQALFKIEYTNGEVDWIGADFNKNDHDWEYTDRVAVAKYDFSRVIMYGKLQNQQGAKVWFDDFNVKFYGSANALMSSFNLAENSSFEYDRDSSNWPDGWPINAPGNESKITWHPTSEYEYGFNGNYMIKISDVTNSAVVSNITPEPIKSGKTYTASAVFKAENVTGSGAILQFNILDSADNVLATKVSEEPITGTTGWTREVLSISETEAKTLHQDAVKLSVSVGTLGATSGSIYVDYVRFNEGSKEVQYSYENGQNYINSVTNQLGNTINIVNDNRGNVKTITDPKNRINSFTYDELDRVETSTNAEGLLTRYIYDDNGGIKQIDNEIISETGPNYYNTAIYKEYNEAGLVKSITDGSWVNSTYFEYDKNLNLTDVNYPNGKGIDYTYDSANRLTDINYSTSGTHFNFQHDANGNITSVFKDSVQTSGIQYDELDRPIQIDFSQAGTYVAFGYNPSSQVNKIENSIVSTKDSDYEIKFDFDQAGLPAAIDGPNGINAAFMYDEEGKIKKSYVEGSGTHYLNYRTYNEVGQIIGYRVENADGDIVLDYQYEYDVMGNRTKEIDLVSGTLREYEYDVELDQIIEERHYDTTQEPDVLTKSITYDYDILGNRTLSSEQGGITNSFEYSKITNEIIKLNGQSLYAHDANGNLIQSDDWQYTYNDVNQLIQATDGTTNVKYEYNSNGLRTKKEIVNEGKIELYFYNDTKLAYITDGNNQLKYFFLRDVTGRPINMIDYTDTTPQTYWYLYDAHGNVVGLADKNGDRVVTYEYDAWGNILNSSSTVNTGDGIALMQANPFRYSGYQYDDESGLYYLKSRYYSPFMGRFITRDAILALNLYAYAVNNPVNYVDPNGYGALGDINGTKELNENGNILDDSNGQVVGSWHPKKLITATDAALVAGGSTADTVIGYELGKVYLKHVSKPSYIPNWNNSGIPLQNITQETTNNRWVLGSQKAMTITGGVVSFAIAGYSIYDNFMHYEYAAERSTIDLIAVALSIGIGAVAATVGAPILIVGLITMGVGFGATMIKNEFFYLKKRSYYDD